MSNGTNSDETDRNRAHQSQHSPYAANAPTMSITATHRSTCDPESDLQMHAQTYEAKQLTDRTCTAGICTALRSAHAWVNGVEKHQ